MKEMMRYGFILAVICIGASLSLATVNSFTKSRIIAQAQAEEKNSLAEVLTGAVRFEAVKLNDEVVYYKAYDKDDRIVGVAFKANAKGYASNIETLAGMDQQGAITAIKIISQNETPGLGARIEERDFTSQFANRDLKGLAEVQAITGATISSKAVIDSVKQKAQEVKELLKSAK